MDAQPQPLLTQSQPSAGKVMLTVFWDSRGPILEHYLETGSTVNSERYSDMLINKLKPAIRNKRRGLLSEGVLLLHDNARPHTAVHTINTLQELHFEVLEHPAYSPDLAPSDYHLFGPLKDALRGRRFATDQQDVWSVSLAVQSRGGRGRGRLCSCVAAGLRDRMAVWLRSCVAMWLQSFVAVWLGGCEAARLWLWHRVAMCPVRSTRPPPDHKEDHWEEEEEAAHKGHCSHFRAGSRLMSDYAFKLPISDPIELRHVFIRNQSDAGDVIKSKSIGIYAVAGRGVLIPPVNLKASARRELDVSPQAA
ncbi:hypothetical protein O3P69_007418 [Scylla paramamosain]|uniref:Mariner Mos1 transposase n=1 Tax=Scylla paramamosain TaxID=85552 RepID=A0AAW0V3C7_SCYPA